MCYTGFIHLMLMAVRAKLRQNNQRAFHDTFSRLSMPPRQTMFKTHAQPTTATKHQHAEHHSTRTNKPLSQGKAALLGRSNAADLTANYVSSPEQHQT